MNIINILIDLVTKNLLGNLQKSLLNISLLFMSEKMLTKILMNILRKIAKNTKNNLDNELVNDIIYELKRQGVEI